MRKVHITVCMAAAILAAGCAKSPKVETNASTKLFLDAWISQFHSSAPKSGNGIYILEDTPGTGDTWNLENGFAKVLYTQTDIEGNISATTDEDIAKMAGLYSRETAFGPRIWMVAEGTYGVYAGLEDALEGMNLGGTRKVLIPSWLMTTNRYSSAEKYYSKSTQADNTIFTLTLLDQSSSPYTWEVEDLEAFVQENMAGVDSTYYGGDESGLKYGFYFHSLAVPAKWAEYEMPSDTTVYIHYTGRLVSGQVFDTTIADTAKVHGIYSPDKTYEPVLINFKEDYDDITMTTSESSLITGFKAALAMMHPYEKARTAFYSPLGYGYTGSGGTIPPFSPISFEIRLVDAP